jgi:hypothetical protein
MGVLIARTMRILGARLHFLVGQKKANNFPGLDQPGIGQGTKQKTRPRPGFLFFW